jgi:hypothetical protein
MKESASKTATPSWANVRSKTHLKTGPKPPSRAKKHSKTSNLPNARSPKRGEKSTEKRSSKLDLKSAERDLAKKSTETRKTQ